MLDMLTGPVAGFILISRPIIYSQKKKKKSSRQGAEQICTDLPFDAPTGSFPPPTAVPPAVLCSSQTAPGCPGPGVAGGERIGWDEDQEEDQVDGL